jgi:4-hydroxybenzoate polyprenyltransferase
MNPVKIIWTVLRSVRPVNLIITALAMFMARYTVIIPILKSEGVSSSVNDPDFVWLVIATMLVAAGGYIINDYFDRGIDNLNRPGTNKTGIVVSPRQSLIIYASLTLAGLVTSWYFGELCGKRYVLLIHLFSAGLLYFYSQSYKKMFLAGNFVISFLSALVLMLTILFDRNSLLSQPVVTVVSAYAIFAFMITLTREVIKDCEDIRGDSAFGATTLPAVLGLQKARAISSLCAMIIIAAILWIQVTQSQWENPVAFLYIIAFIKIPLLFLAVRNFTSRDASHDHKNSLIAKIIMASGILSMPVLYFSSI